MSVRKRLRSVDPDHWRDALPLTRADFHEVYLASGNTGVAGGMYGETIVAEMSEATGDAPASASSGAPRRRSARA